MSDPKRNEDTLSQESEKKKQKTGYVNWWLFRKKRNSCSTMAYSKRALERSKRKSCN